MSRVLICPIYCTSCVLCISWTICPIYCMSLILYVLCAICPMYYMSDVLYVRCTTRPCAVCSVYWMSHALYVPRITCPIYYTFYVLHVPCTMSYVHLILAYASLLNIRCRSKIMQLFIRGTYVIILLSLPVLCIQILSSAPYSQTLHVYSHLP